MTSYLMSYISLQKELWGEWIWWTLLFVALGLFCLFLSVVPIFFQEQSTLTFSSCSFPAQLQVWASDPSQADQNRVFPGSPGLALECGVGARTHQSVKEPHSLLVLQLLGKRSFLPAGPGASRIQTLRWGGGGCTWPPRKKYWASNQTGGSRTEKGKEIRS